MIQAGELRNRITIQRATGTLTNGQEVRTWANLITQLPVKVESVAGGEVIRGRQVVAEATTLFTGRWVNSPTLTAKDRIIWGSRTLNILRAGDPYGTGEELRIEAKELAA